MASLSVAHVANEVGGGMGTVFHILLPAQVRDGHRITFFVRHVKDEDRALLASLGVDVQPIQSTLRLSRCLREFDIVHVHSADLDLLAAAWLSRRTTVFTLHGLRAQTRPVATVTIRRLPTLGGVRRRLKRSALSFVLRQGMTRVTTVSEFLAAKAAESCGVDRRKISVVRNGIALDRFKRRATVPRDTGTVVGWVGRLVPVKRVDVLLRAVATVAAQGLCPDLRVVLVGDGVLRDELESLTRSLGLGKVVEFVGHSAEPERYLAQMDLFVMPSRNEGAGLVVDEAMAAGLPVVVLTDGGGVVELVRRSGGGVVVPDEAALAAEIAALLGDSDRRRALAAAGVAYAEQELDPHAWVVRFDQVYRGALVDSGRPVSC